MKRMLINATQQEELRVALVDGQRLFDLDIERASYESKKSNIYKGRIAGIEPSLEAAFVDYGAGKNGFLPIKEVARSYFPEKYTFQGRPSIKDVLKEGQEVIVQIEKEERGNKGAALSTFISLAGSYLVLMPNNPRAGGISRRIEGEERTELKAALNTLNLPQGMGLIVRTAGVGKSAENLEWDLNVLLNLWQDIQKEADANSGPLLIHQESDVIARAIRDYLRPDIGEILIDNPTIYERAKGHMERMRPDFLPRVKQYTGKVPLFSHYQVESQIESAFQREVRLPSGGSIVIDPTEALTSIDINSARATKGGDIEETALNTNREAAREIARQLRLRDLGGLVVIDFIDMLAVSHQREVEKVLSEAVEIDRARIQFGRISRFGLLEMSRQRLSPSLAEASHHICPRCSGTGVIRQNESLALSVLRLVEEEAIKDNTSQVLVLVPVAIASYLLNEKRSSIRQIEQVKGVNVVIVPDADMETPKFEVARIRKGDELSMLSYLLPENVNQIKEMESKAPPHNPPERRSEAPALKSWTSPVQDTSKKQGVLNKLIAAFKGIFASADQSEQNNQQPSNQHKHHSQSTRSRQTGQRQNSRSGQQTDNKQRNSSGQNTSKTRPQNKKRINTRSGDSDDLSRKQTKQAKPNNNEKQQQVKQRRQRRQMSKQIRVERAADASMPAVPAPAAMPAPATKAEKHNDQIRSNGHATVPAIETHTPHKASEPAHVSTTNGLSQATKEVMPTPSDNMPAAESRPSITNSVPPVTHLVDSSAKDATVQTRPVKPKISITEPAKTAKPEQLVSEIVSSWTSEVVESVKQAAVNTPQAPAEKQPVSLARQSQTPKAQPVEAKIDMVAKIDLVTKIEPQTSTPAKNATPAKASVSQQSTPSSSAQQVAPASSPVIPAHAQAPMTKAVCHDPIKEVDLPVRAFTAERYEALGAGSHSARSHASAVMARP